MDAMRDSLNQRHFRWISGESGNSGYSCFSGESGDSVGSDDSYEFDDSSKSGISGGVAVICVPKMCGLSGLKHHIVEER